MSYYEICSKTLTVVSTNKVLTPYGYSGDSWIGFENPDSLRLKVDFLKMKGLRGAMFWVVDVDDFQNVCGQGKYPLLNAVDKALNSGRVLPSTQVPPVTNKPTHTLTDKPTDKPTKTTKTNAPCQTAKVTYQSAVYRKWRLSPSRGLGECSWYERMVCYKLWSRILPFRLLQV